MRVAVLSDCRVPTRATGGHGLGRVAYDLAAGLKQRGHTVALLAGQGSETPLGVELVTHPDERGRAAMLADIQTGYGGLWHAVVDLSHAHDLSRLAPGAAVVNYVMDCEIDYQPPNAVVANAWQASQFPYARIVPLGVDVKRIPFGLGGEHVVHVAKQAHSKGTDLAQIVARRARLTLHSYGQVVDVQLPEWCGEIDDNAQLYAVLGGALGLLAPSRHDAGGRVILEAAACGTPSLVLDWSGAAAHVEDGVSGFVCSSTDELAEAAAFVSSLDRRHVREWAADCHSLHVMVGGIEAALRAVYDGERW